MALSLLLPSWHWLPSSRMHPFFQGLRTNIGWLVFLRYATVALDSGGYYEKQHAYVGPSFFEMFSFLEHKDEHGGYVRFLDGHSAREAGLVQASTDRVFIGVDTSSGAAVTPVGSVRVSSKDVFSSGIFVLSLDHVPTGCGCWPSLWMSGGQQGYKLDIVEAVHTSTRVTTTLHTATRCDQSSIQGNRDFSGKWAKGSSKPLANDCNDAAPGQWKYQGCEQIGPQGSMGLPFNLGGGGTFVMEWEPTEGHISTWFFRNGTLPPDLADRKSLLYPAAWGRPYSRFHFAEDTCPKSTLRNARIVLDVNLCGSYGDALFKSSCPAEASSERTCSDFVAKHPEALQQAYWSIRRLDVYKKVLAGEIKSAADSVAAIGGMPHDRTGGAKAVESPVLAGMFNFVQNVVEGSHEAAALAGSSGQAKQQGAGDLAVGLSVNPWWWAGVTLAGLTTGTAAGLLWSKATSRRTRLRVPAAKEEDHSLTREDEQALPGLGGGGLVASGTAANWSSCQQVPERTHSLNSLQMLWELHGINES